MGTDEEQREAIQTELDGAKLFLDEDEEKDLEQYRSRLSDLHGHIGPIVERMQEVAQRPDTRKFVDTVLKKLAEANHHILENMPWVDSAKVEKAWGDAEKFREWWEKKDASQEKLAAHEAPVFLI